MKIGVMVQEGPYHRQSADSAYQFIGAAMDKGHEIVGVFFYHDGVNNSSKLSEPQSDDRNIQKRWSELAEKGVDLVLCIAASKRRGVTDDVIYPGFRISGLGQLANMIITADRFVSFGA